MKKFSELGIKTEQKGFTGNKIGILDILNQEIEIHDYKIETSKLDNNKGNGKCLHLQIVYENAKRVVFTGSGNLMNDIELVGKENLPISTIIRKRDKLLYFS